MQDPRPESRISSVEKRTTKLEAQIEELSSDTAEELRAIRQDIKQLNEGMMASFKQIGEHFGLIEKENATKEDIRKLEKRFDKVEATLQEILARLPKQE